MARSTLVKFFTILMAFGLLATACGSDEEGGSAAETGGEIRVGKVEPTFIDSYNIQDSEGFAVGRLLYDGLTDFDSDLNAVPAVAESWEHVDFTTWTFTLRADTKFHNDETVTAQSFVNAFNYLASPDAASDVSYYGLVADVAGFSDTMEAGGDVTGVTAVDDTTLEITLNGPNPLLPKILGHPAFSPRPESAMTDPTGNNETPIGNGPYKMSGAWEHNVRINLERFDAYYGTAGLADKINFLLFDTVETMFLEVQAGNLDLADVPPEQIDAAKAEFGDRFLEVAIGSYNYLGLPNNTAPFDNPEIRKALSLAIDRDTITQELFAGTRDPADGFYPPLAPGGTPGICTNCAYDPALAKETFDAAGGIDGDSVVMSFNSGGGHEGWTEAVCNNWEQNLGITCEFQSQEFSPYLDQIQSGDIPGPFRLGWGWDYPHAEGFLTPLLRSDSGDNLVGYNNADVDRLLNEFRQLDNPDGADAKTIVADVSTILNDEMPLIPMFFSRGQRVHAECLTGDIVLNAFDFVELEKASTSCGGE